MDVSDLELQQEDLIEQVRVRPGLWDQQHPTDRVDKLMLWKEIGGALFEDWNDINKATAYDRVLQLQRKWRSLKDGYMRELRIRRRGIKKRRTYIYFNQLTFLGGYEGLPESEVTEGDEPQASSEDEPDPLISKKKKGNARTPRRAKIKVTQPEVEDFHHDDFTNDVAPISFQEEESDGDKLFLMSFLPELRKLPTNLKMWVRAQIANVMQEAVSSDMTNTAPSLDKDFIKRRSSFDN